MAIHKPNDFHFITLDGNTLTSGGSKSLSKGQVGIFDIRSQTPKGTPAVSSYDKRKTYAIKVGKADVGTTRSAQTSKPWSSVSFKLSDIRDVYVSAPKVKEQKFDIFLVGYDGINTDTALTFEQGDQLVFDITLSGDPIGELGYKDSYVCVKIYVDVAPDDIRTNQEIVEDMVQRIKDYKLMNQVPLTNYIDVTTIDSSKSALVGDSYSFYSLEIKDEGGSNGLARVQAQYPDYPVKRLDYIGITSTYQLIAPSGTSISDYVESIASYIKNCEDCLAGYSELESGFVYSVSLEDEGADETATVQALPGAVTDSAQKVGQEYGVGIYSVVTDDELTQAEIDAFIASEPTAQVALVGDVVAVCSNSTTTTTSWVEGDSCTASVQTYTIQLPDTECGESRLSELSAAYPELSIVEGAPTGYSIEATLTGTSGTANINVNGTDYLATFNTDLATTASDFDDTHSAALTAAGVEVADAGAVLTFTSEDPISVSVTNATGDLAGTVAAIEVTTSASTGGCQRVYSALVTTNIVCEDCDPILNDLFYSEAPEDFEFTPWELVEDAADENALMGIQIKGKPFILEADECLIDEIPFYETSTKIEVAGGYATDTNVSFKKFNDRFNVKLIERAQDRDHLGYHYRSAEDISRTFFDGTPRHVGNNFAKVILGEESLLKPRAQYVDYVVVVGDTKYAQSMSGRVDTAVAYHIVAEVGRHLDVESLVNGLAVAAGLDPVQAFGND